MRLLYFIVFLQTFLSIDCANILGIFHYPSYGHQIVFQKIVKDLSARGHHLTILTVNRINENYPNVTEIFMDGMYDNDELNYVELKAKNFGVVKMFCTFFRSIYQRTFIQLNHPEVKKLIADKKQNHFDLVLIDYIYQNPLIYFAEIYECPVVAVSSFEVTNFVHSIFGNSVNPAINPEYIHPYEQGKLSIVERLVSGVTHILLSLMVAPAQAIGDIMLKQYFPGVDTSFNEIHEHRLEFLLQNANPVLGATRPVTQNTIMLGNLHIEPPKEIRGELKEVLDSIKNEIVYVSFGTNVNTENFNEKTLSVLINTFKRLNYDILWKLDGDHSELLNETSNIHVSKWFPQADLLAHPKIKLFITHCGLMSLEESIDREVPMIAIPFQFDQYKNAHKVKSEEIGVLLEFESLNENTLHDAILEATKSKYKENIRQFKTLCYDVPMQSREKAVWWIEYALRNKGRNRLKYIGARVPFYQKYYLDIGLIIATICFSAKRILSVFGSTFVKKIKIE